MTMTVRGRALVLGDGISTDQMIAGKYCRLADPRELAAHLFEEAGLEGKKWNGAIILAGRNFGCGSSREQAPIALKAAGVRAIAAISFGRIFFRNAINIGLPVMNIGPLPASVRDGDAIAMDVGAGVIRNRTMDFIKGRPIPDFLMEILEAGGLTPYMKVRLSRGKKAPRSP